MKKKITIIGSVLVIIGLSVLGHVACTKSQKPVSKTGKYRNLFIELGGHSKEQVDAKIRAMKKHFFFGENDQKIYYETVDGAYIYDTGNEDVRSEGMSYGMMIALQLDMKDRFDKLWKWAKKNMQHHSGDWKGYFAWHCKTDGEPIDYNPAPDGEEYFAMALFFAWKKWGDVTYKKEADYILDSMLHQGERAKTGSNVYSMINEFSGYKMICFVPYGDSALFTDPSYHLPAFYELFALWAEKDNKVWKKMADTSRDFFKKTIHPKTGLGPDYAMYNGKPKHVNGHGEFRFDAWRTTMNIAVDYYWWGVDDWAVTHADTIQAFFENEGLFSYGNQYEISGKKLSNDHSVGLVAMNAVAGLNAANRERAKKFLNELWTCPLPKGKWRYYDGCLYMMAMLHLSGEFNMFYQTK